MINDKYEEYYDKQFMSYYNKNKMNNEDEICDIPHPYSIPTEKRELLYNLEVYTIDPSGSEDADDAFSLENDEKTGKLYLYIHISDPTEYINLHSKLWKQICRQGYTMYPSNRKPIHLMPQSIMTLASLHDKNNSETCKNAITIKVHIDETTYQVNINDITIIPSHIKIKKDNAYAYNDAKQIIKNNTKINICLKIADNLRNARGEYAVKLSNVNNAYPVYNNTDKRVELYLDSDDEVKMKQMIAEFAILSNNIIAEYITSNLKEKHNIFRCCDLKKEDKTNFKNKSGNEIIEYIVSNGVRACYNSIKTNHDLVQKQYYVHFTSPLRRANDCVCHYIVKYIIIKKNNEKIVFPFKKDNLFKIMKNFNETNKSIKKMQYNDMKYRTVQAMDNILHKNVLKQSAIAIKFKILSYSGIFLNICIVNIDQYPVYLIMFFKRQFLNHEKIINLIRNNVILYGTIRTIYFQESVLDAGKFPELEQFLTSFLY